MGVRGWRDVIVLHNASAHYVAPMPLSRLRRSSLAWLERPFGRVVALLWIAAVLSSALHVDMVHAHADGNLHHTHHHLGDAPDGGGECNDPGASADLPGDAVLHAHDAGLMAALAPVAPVSGVAMLAPAALVAPAPAADVLPKPLLSPLYRPPIA